MAKKSFNLQLVDQHLKSALHAEDDIILQEYIYAYTELNRLFPQLGILFSFVEQDVNGKLTSLQVIATKKEGVSVLTIVKEETTQHNISGSAHLIRLHRALEFVSRLIEDIANSEEERGMTGLSKSAYDDTLGKYHPWVIRKGVRLALKTLPNRKQLHPILLNDLPKDKAKVVVQELLGSIQEVYRRMDLIFTQYNLHHIPQS